MKKQKKAVAAMAAVLQYIKAEEEAAQVQPAAAAVERAGAPVRLWGVSGRQAQMQLRTMMQMRTFR